MKYKEVDGERVCTCPPECDDCDERTTCLEAGPLLQPLTSKKLRCMGIEKDPWPKEFRVTMSSKQVHKQTGWQFNITDCYRPNNMVQLTCETEGLGTITWQGTAQQFLREFMKAEQHAAEQAERQRTEPPASF